MRHQQHGKEDGNGERAEVIEGQDLRDDILEHQVALEDTHDQGNFQSDENADAEHCQVERQLERSRRPGEDEEQRSRRKAAQHTDQQLDLDEAGDEMLLDVARQP
jgi:hypothetical protein